MTVLETPPSSKPRGGGELVDIKRILVSKDRGRKDFKHLSSLKDSIEKLGLAHPLVVSISSTNADKLDLIAGERRYRCCALLGWAKVPVVFRNDLTSIEKKELELEENLFREQLKWSEECELVKQIDEVKRELYGSGSTGLKDETDEKWTQAKTAIAVNQSESMVSQKINFATLMSERPDLKTEVEQLPLFVAMRVVKQKLEQERLDRLSKSGKLKLHDELLEGNVIDLLDHLEDNSIDLLLTDPPFGISTISEMAKTKTEKSQVYTQILNTDDNSTQLEVELLIKTISAGLFRVLKPSSHFYIFHSATIYSCLVRELKKVGFEVYSNPLVWDKGRTTSPFRGYAYSPCYEPILFGFKGPKTKRLFKPCRDILPYPPISAKDKVHPFEKPQDLLTYLIKQSTNIGDLVLDPFAGSGSTLIASKSTQRSCIGFELNHSRFLSAQLRLLSFEDKTAFKDQTAKPPPSRKFDPQTNWIKRGVEVTLIKNPGPHRPKGIVECRLLHVMGAAVKWEDNKTSIENFSDLIPFKDIS